MKNHKGYNSVIFIFCCIMFVVIGLGCASGAHKGIVQKPGEAVVKEDKKLSSEVGVVEGTSCQEGLMLVESWPSETRLDNPHIEDVLGVWLDMIQGAQSSIDFSHFYAISREGKGLEKVIDVLGEAIKRGVRVRFIIDQQLNHDVNAVLPQRLVEMGVEVRILETKKIMGGVQHSKYFIVDNAIGYLGSQNFDWRSLEEISEMGVKICDVRLVQYLLDIFNYDWELAGLSDPAKDFRQVVLEKKHYEFPLEISYRGEKHKVWGVSSPKGFLFDESTWDLSFLISLIDQSKERIYVQLLSFKSLNYDKESRFFELEEALKRAASRGVNVRILLGSWQGKSQEGVKDIERLNSVNGIEVKLLEIPVSSEGEVPFSRVIHSKFMVVDHMDSWLGTSNWGGDYFYKSRNVGIVVHGKFFNQDLVRSFERYWEYH